MNEIISSHFSGLRRFPFLLRYPRSITKTEEARYYLQDLTVCNLSAYLLIGNSRSMKLRFWELTRSSVENDFRIKEINAEERVTFQNKGN